MLCRFCRLLPAEGAGTLETRGSEDHYSFTMSQPGALFMETLQCVEGTEMTLWRYYPADGWYEVWPSWYCEETWDDSHFVLDAADYRLQVKSYHGATGDYSFRLGPPDIEEFNVGDEFTASPGVPQPGAGTLETDATVDRYNFTVPSEQGYVVTTSGCTNDVYTRLLHQGTEWTWSWSCDSPTTTYLDPGDYQLDVFVDYGIPPGDYTLNLARQPEPQTFAIGLGDTIFDGNPGPGAGNLEDLGSADLYTFAVQTPGFVLFDGDDCPDSTTGWLTSTWPSQSIRPCDDRLVFLYPGTYVYSISSSATGTYSLTITNP